MYLSAWRKGVFQCCIFCFLTVLKSIDFLGNRCDEIVVKDDNVHLLSVEINYIIYTIYNAIFILFIIFIYNKAMETNGVICV